MGILKRWKESHAAMAKLSGESARKTRTGRKAAIMSMLGRLESMTDVIRSGLQAAPFVVEDRSAGASP